jgi:hypothetical protein
MQIQDDFASQDQSEGVKGVIKNMGAGQFSPSKKI